MHKKAFTLAEVLITLGIIGIVAAMTMPALIASHRKKEVVTKLQKIYSIVNQAINLSVAEYGDVKNWAADCGSSNSPTCTTEEAKQWFNTYIGKHLQILKIENADTNKAFFVYLKDGTILYVENCIYDMKFYINKKAIDNRQMGINCFAFRFNPVLGTTQIAEDNKYTLKPTFEPYTWSWDGTREGLLNKEGYGCKTIGGGYCTKLIQFDGWQIKDDYPKNF